MLRDILELLREDHYYGKSEIIEIAKGKNELPESWEAIKNQFKRQLQWRLRK